MGILPMRWFDGIHGLEGRATMFFDGLLGRQRRIFPAPAGAGAARTFFTILPVWRRLGLSRAAGR